MCSNFGGLWFWREDETLGEFSLTFGYPGDRAYFLLRGRLVYEPRRPGKKRGNSVDMLEAGAGLSEAALYTNWIHQGFA